MKDIGGPQQIIFKVMKNTKNDIMNVKHINVSIGENEISYSIINENESNFMCSLYNHGLPIFNNEISFK
jgi:hypothetical protein